MEFAVIAAMLVAALLHASWHALIKGHADRLVGLAGMNVVSTGLVLCMVPFVSFPQAAAWPLLLAALPFHIAYKFGLSKIYGQGDLGQVFPIARGATPVLATVLAFVLMRELPSTTETLAIGLISAGIFIIAREKCAAPITRQTLLSGLFTGSMVAAYSVLNGAGARLNEDWLGYTVWLIILDGILFIGMVWARRGNAWLHTIKQNTSTTLISGLLGTTAFMVFVWALSQSTIGSVAALRETSILFATLIGFLFLKEKFSLSRMFATVMVTLGVILFGFAA